MKKFYVVFVAITLIGCRGGGAAPGRPANAPLPPGTSMHVQRYLSIAVTASTGRSTANLRVKADATGPPPQVFFGVPDSYVQHAPTFFELNAVAFLDLPPGTAFPSPAPSVAWTQIGPMVVSKSYDTTNPRTGELSLFVGTASRTVGKTQLVATIVGAGSAEIDIFNFHALGITCTANGLPGGTYPQGLSFDASGTAVPRSSVAASDIALVGAPCAGTFASPSQKVSISIPNGSTQPFPTSSAQTSFVGLTTAQFMNQATSIDPDALQVAFGYAGSSPSAPSDKLLFKTRDGRFVKFLAIQMSRASGSSGAYLTGLYGFYSVSDSNGNFSI